MVAQSPTEYQRQVDEVILKAGEYNTPDIPSFLKRAKRIERVERKKLPTENS
jgi:hypothetical protein